RLRRVDRLADELAPEGAAVLAAVLALGGDGSALAHLLVPGGVALELLARAVDPFGALADELARPVAEHLLETPVAALVGAVAHERDADGRVVEDQLLLGERALHALVRLALGGDVLEAPDPFLDFVPRIDASAACAAAEGRPVAPSEPAFVVVRLSRRRGAIGELARALPLLGIGKERARALADQLPRPGADHFLEIPVAALDGAVAHESDADAGVVEDQLLLGERPLDALLGLVLLGDVLEEPDRAVRRVARLHRATGDRAPDQAAVLAHMLAAKLLRLAAPHRLVHRLAARLVFGVAPEHETGRAVDQLARPVAEDSLEAAVA